MTWTPPEEPSLSTADITNVVAGLRDPESRAAALAFLEYVDEHLLYVVAARLVDNRRSDKPRVGMAAEQYRAWIAARV